MKFYNAPMLSCGSHSMQFTSRETKKSNCGVFTMAHNLGIILCFYSPLPGMLVHRMATPQYLIRCCTFRHSRGQAP